MWDHTDSTCAWTPLRSFYKLLRFYWASVEVHSFLAESRTSLGGKSPCLLPLPTTSLEWLPLSWSLLALQDGPVSDFTYGILRLRTITWVPSLSCADIICICRAYWQKSGSDNFRHCVVVVETTYVVWNLFIHLCAAHESACRFINGTNNLETFLVLKYSYFLKYHCFSFGLNIFNL